MYARKLRRRCDVRGCKETVTYSLSRTRENGNTPIMCEKCLKEALEAVRQCKTEPAPRKQATAPPPIFPHPELETGTGVDTAEFDLSRAGEINAGIRVEGPGTRNNGEFEDNHSGELPQSPAATAPSTKRAPKAPARSRSEREPKTRAKGKTGNEGEAK